MKLNHFLGIAAILFLLCGGRSCTDFVDIVKTVDNVKDQMVYGPMRAVARDFDASAGISEEATPAPERKQESPQEPPQTHTDPDPELELEPQDAYREERKSQTNTHTQTYNSYDSQNRYPSSNSSNSSNTYTSYNGYNSPGSYPRRNTGYRHNATSANRTPRYDRRDPSTGFYRDDIYDR